MISWVQVALASISLAREIVQLLHTHEKSAKTKANKLRAMKEAMKGARDGNTSQIEHMFSDLFASVQDQRRVESEAVGSKTRES